MKGKQSACAFTGYRPQKLPWMEDESDLRCVDLGCDLYFGELVLGVKREWPEITLEAAVPCPTQADSWAEDAKLRWKKLLRACDYETMVQDHYTLGCMMRRNRYMIDHASMLIAVYDGQEGGTRRTVEYAMRRQIPVVFVPPVA